MSTSTTPHAGNPNGHLPLTLIIEGREFQWSAQYISGKEIRHLAGLSDESDVYLALVDPWDDEPVPLASQVDLAREGVESFYVRNPLFFQVNGKNYQSKKQYITGADIRRIAGLSDKNELFLLLQKPYEDEPITDNTQVNLARPGIEEFRVRKKDEDIMVSIRINDNPFTVKRGTYTVAALKKLGTIPQSDELSELVHGKLKPLPDDGSVVVKGGEEFFSCKREGSSS